MHSSIFNYDLNLVSRQNILLPVGANIISAQDVRGKVCLCAMADPYAKTEVRTFAIIEGGRVIDKVHPDEHLSHIDTVQQYGLVWHVFEIVQNDADDLKNIRFGQEK